MKKGNIRVGFYLVLLAIVAYVMIAMAIGYADMKRHELIDHYTTYKLGQDPDTGRTPSLQLIVKKELGDARYNYYGWERIYSAIKELNGFQSWDPKVGMEIKIPDPPDPK